MSLVRYKEDVAHWDVNNEMLGHYFYTNATGAEMEKNYKIAHAKLRV